MALRLPVLWVRQHNSTALHDPSNIYSASNLSRQWGTAMIPSHKELTTSNKACGRHFTLCGWLHSTIQWQESECSIKRSTAAGKNPLTEGLRVLVLDRAPLPEVISPLAEAPELRVSTLTPASVRLLRESGAWDDIAPPRSATFKHMQVRSEPSGRSVPTDTVNGRG